MAAPWRSGVALHVLVLLSGIAGLGYQIVWVRMMTTGLGHEVYSVLAIVAAFFTGLAIGGVLIDRVLRVVGNPGLVYASLEAAICVWALALVWLLPVANGWLADLTGPQASDLWRWAIAFCGSTLVLLPATVAMGATLPAAQAIVEASGGRASSIGGLYAINTAGAMIGALVVVFWLAPLLGFSAVLAGLALVNGLVAVWALVQFRRPSQGRDSAVGTDADTPTSRSMLTLFFLTGLLGIGFEIAAVRALSQVLENTVYSFAAILSVYLLGTAAGAAIWQRVGDRVEWVAAPAILAVLTGFATLAGTLGVFGVHGATEIVRQALGAGTGYAIIAELLAAAVVVLPASLVSGALFASLAARTRTAGCPLGPVFAANAIGAAIAPLAVGLWLIPALGLLNAMICIAGLYSGVALLLLPGTSFAGRSAAAFPAVAAAIATAGLGTTPFVDLSRYGSTIQTVDGTAATVTVTETLSRQRWLLVNGTRVMGGTSSHRLDRIQGHAILMQHPEPKRALFLGVGTGATVAAAADHPDLETVGVELLPEVLETIPAFKRADDAIRAASERITLHAADARRWVRADPTTYDVIIADNFHPARDGVAMLYTVEHFATVRQRLAPGGIFAQWLPLHQLDLQTLRTIVRTFQSVFPDARMQMGNFNLATPLLVLIGTEDGTAPRLADSLGDRVTPVLGEALEDVGLRSPFALYGGFLGGSKALATFAGDGPLNTDDHPHVLFQAPRTVYERMDAPADRLLMLTSALDAAPKDAVTFEDVSGGEAFAKRLARFWDARDAFLRIGQDVRVTGNFVEDARRLSPALLQILQISPDFDPAYDPVLQMARRAFRYDPETARVLLAALMRANPGRSDAAALARELFPRG